MEANERNLIQALKLCAQAHGKEFCDWSDGDNQVAIKDEGVPVVADVQSIVRAFTGDENFYPDSIETDFGYTTIYLDEIEYAPVVDERTLRMALPNGIDLGLNENKNTVRLNESQLRKLVAESVKKVLNEISYGMARDAFKKAGEELDNNPDYYLDSKKMKRFDNLHQHFVDRSRENFDPNMPVLICFDDHCESLTAGELEDKFEVEGYVEPSRNPIYANQKMVGYPYLKGLIGPMWDYDRLRYETQAIYDMMSM
jgi:hypothetical protein